MWNFASCRWPKEEADGVLQSCINPIFSSQDIICQDSPCQELNPKLVNNFKEVVLTMDDGEAGRILLSWPHFYQMMQRQERNLLMEKVIMKMDDKKISNLINQGKIVKNSGIRISGSSCHVFDLDWAD